VATFYIARSEIITPLPWSTFALPFSDHQLWIVYAFEINCHSAQPAHLFLSTCSVTSVGHLETQKFATEPYAGGLDLVRSAYADQGLFTIGVGTGSWEAIPSRRALASWDDFKGMKLRTPPGLGSLIWEHFGAVPIVMPQTEVFSALEKGVIDGADDGSLSYNLAVGDYDIVKNTLINSPHSNGIWDFSVNTDRWNALPADIQSILETNMREVMVRNIMNAMRGDEAALKKAPEIGLNIFELTSDQRAEYRKVAVGIWDEWAEKSPLAKKVIETHKAFLREKGLLEQ
jgi:TRAP-type C4-dicarboxylate transport system substrate-binding protein